MKYLFYPGCSLQRSARPYLDSTLAIEKVLGIGLQEIEDWNCCGATEYHSIHHVASFALIARNLALAAQHKNGTPALLAACSACYLNLAKTDSYMFHDQQLNQQVNTALAAGGLEYQPRSVTVRHLLDVIVNDIGLEAVGQHVTRPLHGLRVAPYYGCMIARPDRDHRWDRVEHPVAMDHLLTALGAEVVDFPLKTHCCGGHMTQINEQTAYELIRRLVHTAAEFRADVMVTLCPMCQLNLDAYQGEMNKFFRTNYRVPIIYFTQLMGLAFGIDADTLGLGKEFVDARPALRKIGVVSTAAESDQPGSARPRRKKGEREPLPMPRMPASEEVEEP